ncbi:hypothetical protein K523DRAFT_323141 [Schizophyllum commune Tattone D]|nr:hypothetical protein K523DRAFT_323141 [Schizophyllum commune Tattone D]
MPSILSKVFGRKKDHGESRSHARQSRTSLLDGKFERVSPTVSPSVENFPDAGQRKELEKNNDFKLTLNLPGVKEETGGRVLDTVFEAVPSSSISERRLSPAEALILLRACSQSIIAHGLETLGIMHPHWYSSSPEDQRRLISLFIHSLNSPAQSPSAAPAADFASEVKYARSPHDVAAVLRWGLRHLQLDSAAPEFGKESGWYTKFSTGERQGNYPPRAFQDLLVPLLPDPHRELLVTMLDTVSSIASHSEANGISGSKLAKFIGLWFLTSQRAIDDDDFASFYARWERMGRILEHLFLARIREESLRLKMPRRLTELVKRYPYSYEPDSDLLPRPPFSTRLDNALYVRVETEIAPSVVPTKVHPLRVLAEALKAEPPADASEAHVALWNKLRRLLNSDAETNLGNVFADDTIRLLALVPANNDLDYATTRRQLLPYEGVSTATTSPITSPISPPTTSFATPFSATSSAPTSVPASPTRASAALPTNGSGQPLDWAQFSSAGFLESKDIAPLAATLLDTDVEVTTPPSRQSSKRRVPRLTGLDRVASSVQARAVSPSRALSRSRSRGASQSGATSLSPADVPLPTTPIPRTQAKTTQVFVRQLDEAFVDFWADGVVDPIAADWPSFVLCRLKEPGVEEGLSVPKVEWVVIEHAYKKVEPPAPVTEESVEAVASPRPSLTTDTAGSRKRFSLWTRGSSKRNTSKAGRIGELGEILSDGEEEAEEEGKKVLPKSSKEKVSPVKEEKEKEVKEEKDKKEDKDKEGKEKKGKMPLKFAGIKRKSVDIRRSLEVPSSPVPRKSSEVLPKGDREAKEKVDREASEAKVEDKSEVAEGVAAVAAGAVVGGAAVAVAEAVSEDKKDEVLKATPAAVETATPGGEAATEESAAPSATETLTEPAPAEAVQAADATEPAPVAEPVASVDEPVTPIEEPIAPTEENAAPTEEPAAPVEEPTASSEELPVPSAEVTATVEAPVEASPAPVEEVPAAALEPDVASPPTPEPPVVEELPAVEETPAPVEEPSPVVEEALATTDAVVPPSEEVSAVVEEEAPAVEELAPEPAPVVEEETPVAKSAPEPAVEAVSVEKDEVTSPQADEVAPTVEEAAAGPLEESVEEPIVAEEAAPSPPVEESAPVEEGTVAEEVAAEEPAEPVEAPATETEPVAAPTGEAEDVETPAAAEPAAEGAVQEESAPADEPIAEAASARSNVGEEVVDTTEATAPVEAVVETPVAPSSAEDQAPAEVVMDEETKDATEVELSSVEDTGTAAVEPEVKAVDTITEDHPVQVEEEASVSAPLASDEPDAAPSPEPAVEDAPATTTSTGAEEVPADTTSPEATEATESEAVESTQVDDTASAPDAGRVHEASVDAEDELVDLPPVPVVSSEPIPPANVPAVPDVTDVPSTPSADVPSATEAAVPEETLDMPPAPESVVASGATPGPQVALDSSEPAAAAEAAAEEKVEESVP